MGYGCGGYQGYPRGGYSYGNCCFGFGFGWWWIIAIVVIFFLFFDRGIL